MSLSGMPFAFSTDLAPKFLQNISLEARHVQMLVWTSNGFNGHAHQAQIKASWRIHPSWQIQTAWSLIPKLNVEHQLRMGGSYIYKPDRIHRWLIEGHHARIFGPRSNHAWGLQAAWQWLLPWPQPHQRLRLHLGSGLNLIMRRPFRRIDFEWITLGLGWSF